MEVKKRLDRYLFNILIPNSRHPIRTILPYLAGLLWISVMGNFLFSLLNWVETRWRAGNAPPPQQPPWLVLYFCLIAVALLVLVSFFVKSPPLASTQVPPNEAPPPFMKGIIMLLSFYSPRDLGRGGLSFDDFTAKLSFENKTAEEWRELEEAAKRSNFDVPLQAIRYHLKDDSLRHVWLICTTDAQDANGQVIVNEKGHPGSPGSWRVAPYLEKFIKEAPHQMLAPEFGSSFNHSGRVQFHYHSEEQPKPEYLVNFIGEQGARDVYKAVTHIFDDEVEIAGLETDEVICDLTGGRTPHTVGMVMACLPARRKIQYTSSVQTPDNDYPQRPAPREIRAEHSFMIQLFSGVLAEETKES